MKLTEIKWNSPCARLEFTYANDEGKEGATYFTEFMIQRNPQYVNEEFKKLVELLNGS